MGIVSWIVEYITAMLDVSTGVSGMLAWSRDVSSGYQLTNQNDHATTPDANRYIRLKCFSVNQMEGRDWCLKKVKMQKSLQQYFSKIETW